MRVVYVSSLVEGGPVSHLLGLAPTVAAAGAEVRVLCGGEAVAGLLREAGVDAEAAPLRDKRDVAGARYLWSRLRGADIVHTQDRRSLLLCGAAARQAGARLVHTYHGLPEELVGMPGRPAARPEAAAGRAAWLLQGHLRVEALLARLGDVVVPSRAMAGFLGAHGFAPRRLHVLPSRIDVRRTVPGPPHHPPRLAVAARLETHKGVDVLLDACSRLEEAVHVDLYGDGACRPALQAQASRLGLDVHFWGTVGDVRDRLLGADLFVLPSRGENLPISILEAMAAALPVVASRVGGIPELVDDGVTGCLAEPGDAASLAAALQPLVADAGLRAEMGAAGARRVAEHFDASHTGDEMVDLYRGLLA